MLTYQNTPLSLSLLLFSPHLSLHPQSDQILLRAELIVVSKTGGGRAGANNRDFVANCSLKHFLKV